MVRDEGKTRTQLIAELKEARQRIAALEASRWPEDIDGNARLLLGALESPLCSLFVKDVEGRFLFCNEQLALFLAVPRSEILGKTDYDFLPKEAADLFRTEDQGLIAKKQPFCSEGSLDMGGSPVHYTQYKFPISDGSGKVIAVGGMAIDITNRKRLEEELLKQRDSLEQVVAERTVDLQRANHELATREALLNEGQAKLQRILDATTDGIWFWDFRRGSLDFSPNYYTMLGYDPYEFSPSFENWKNLIHPEDLDRALQIARDFLKFKPDNYENEFRLKAKDGRYVWMLAKGRVVERDEHGEAVLMIGNHQDTTNRKLAEEALRESETRFRLLSEVSFTGVAIHNQGVLLDANKQYFEMFGYRPHELLGKQAAAITVAPEAKEALFEKMGSGTEKTYESVGLRKDGSTFPMEITVRNINFKGAPARAAMISDITGRKLAEEKIRKSEDKFRSFYEEVGEGIILSNDDSDILDANPAALKMLGYSLEELRRLNAVDLVHPDDLRELPPVQKRKDAREKGVIRLERRYRRKDGAYFPVFVTISSLKTGGLHLVMFRDFSSIKQAEERLVLERKRLQNVLDAIPGFVYLQRPDYRIEYANQRFINLFGEPGDRPCFELLHGRDKPCVPCPTFAVFETNHSAKWEWKENDERFWAISNAPFKGLDGSPLVLEIGVDITEIQRARETLKKSEARLLEAQSLAKCGSWEFDVHTGEIWGSDEGFHIYGMTPPSSNLLPVDEIEACILEKERVHQALVDLINNDQPYDLEFDIFPADGSARKTIISKAKLERDDKGTPTRVSGVILDITERKKVEVALREIKERYDLAMNATEDGVFDWNLITNTIYYSPGWKSMLGYEYNELPNDFTVWEKLTRPEDVVRSWDMQQELIAGKRDRFEMEFKMKHKDGHWVDILSRANAVFDENGQAVRIVGTHVDITERKRSMEFLAQSEKMMSLGGVAAGMAHEINNPLAGMMGNAQTIENRLVGDVRNNDVIARECGVPFKKIREYTEARGILKMLKAIQESGVTAAKIVSNTLAFSRKSARVFAHTDLAELLDSTLELAASDYDLKKRYDFRGIEAIREYDPDLPLVYCDSNEMQQVFFNLFRNGAEAMKGKQYPEGQKSRFVLCVRRQDDMAVVEVQDNGTGMDEETRLRIFEPFFTTKGVGKGTGLGLSVSYFIVTDQHNGSMEVDSVPGEWTRFTIKLPIKGKEQHGNTEVDRKNWTTS